MSIRTLFDEIKAHFEIVDFISQFINLKKVGRNYIGLCPFHIEKTPSFTVSPEKQIFKCFGCGAAGDVVTFYMKLKGLDFKDALFELAEKAGIKIDNSYFIEKNKEKMEVELNFKVAKIYQNFLWNHPLGEKARLYIKERGLRDETSKTFFLGYAPAEGRVLASLLRAQKIDLELACEIGLLRKERDNSFLDLFRDRLIFPIFNERGECVGFAGRALNPHIEPKYLNSPESKIFKKGELLYGLFQSKDYIKKEGHCLIVEGYFDFLTLWDKGIRNVVATCGTALTDKHLSKLKLLCDEFTLFFDGDKAGRQATVKAISLFAKEGKLPKVIPLPEDLDPDSLLRTFSSSEEKLKEKLQQNLMDVFTFLKNTYSTELKRDPGKVFKEYLEIFKGVTDPFLQVSIARELAFQFNIPETEVLLGIKEKHEERKLIQSPEFKEEGLKILSQYLVNYPEDLSQLEEVGLQDFLKEEKESPYKTFLLKFLELRPRTDDLFFAFSEESLQDILSDLLFSPPFEDKNATLTEIKKFIQRELKKRELRKLCESLKSLEKSTSNVEIETFLYQLNEKLKDKLFCNKI